MMISNKEQLLLLLRCLGCGVWLDLTWVVLGRIRRYYTHTKLARFLFDCVCAILSGLGLFFFSLAVSGGELRAAMLAAIGIGCYVSHLSIGRLLSRILQLFRCLLQVVCTVWERGFAKCAQGWRKIRKKVGFFYKKGLQSRYSWVYNRTNK